MERDREGERAVSDLRGLEPCAVHPMQGPTQHELVADENSIVNLGRIEVDPARPSEIGAERFLHPAGLDVDTDASCPDPECSTAQILGPRECANRVEGAGCQVFTYSRPEPPPTTRPLHRSWGLQATAARRAPRG